MTPEVEAVVEHLHEKYWEAMMGAAGEAWSFAVLSDPGSGYESIRIGDSVLWDSEDTNSGGDQTFDAILEECEMNLHSLAAMFSVFKIQSEPNP